jgi:predicted MPP superfamily phosphohydrolase
VLLRQLIKRGFAVLIILFIALIIYIIWDNNRITVAEQEIGVSNLPEEFEGFKILQVTDLHEKEFGHNQKRLIETINAIDYDAIVFTGDMLNNSTSTNYRTFYSLIEGIRNKENALYIKGNADPENYQSHIEKPFVRDEFINGMEERGVKLLESNYTIKSGISEIHFVDFELSIKDIQNQIKTIDKRLIPENTKIDIRSIPENVSFKDYLNDYLDYQKQLLEEVTFLDEMNHSDVLIALNHYPVVDKRIDYLISEPDFVFRDYDLIIAGHYHGGQIRLPFIGALFVPEAWYEPNSFFPPQDRVKGLWEYKQTKQYVSTGLGSSDFIPFLKFRLFNPPEINVLTLK